MAVDLHDKNDTENDGVYDKEADWKRPTPTASDLEDQFAAPSADDDNLPAGHPSRLDSGKIKTAEEGGGKSASGDERGGSTTQTKPAQTVKTFGYREEGKSKKKGSMAKKVLAGGGIAGGLGIILAIFFIFFMASTLKIQNLAQHVLEYNMLSTARTFRAGSSDIFTEKVLADSSEETFASGLKSQLGENYKSLRSSTWGKFDKFRPQKVLDNLKAGDNLQYVYQEVDRKILPGKKLDLQAIRVNGQDVPIAELKTGQYFSNLTERVKFSAQIDAALERALPDTPNLIRGRVAAEIRSSLGIKLRWWEKAAKDFKGLKQDAAFKLEQQSSATKVGEDPSASCVTTPICDQAKEAADATKKKIADGSAPETDLATVEQIRSGAVSEVDQEAKSTVLQSIRNATQESALAGALQTASGYYNIVLPLCMIYDASVVRAQPIIDNKNASYQKAFYGLESAATQQRIGSKATNAEAVGALNNKLGDISKSIPEQRAYGKTVNTKDFVGVPDQAQNGGISEDLSIANVFGGDNFATKQLNDSLDTLCPIILDTKTVVAAVTIQVLLAVFSGGSSAAAEETAAAGATRVAGEAAGEIAAEVTAKAAGEVATNALERTLSDKAKDVVLKLGRDTIVIGGTSILAKLLVLAHMGGNTTGLETGGSFANRADMGGNLHSNELHRTALMGRPQTPTEVLASRVQDQKDVAKQNQKASVFQRYLAMDNPHSLVANIGFGMTSKWGSSIQEHMGILRSVFSIDFTKNLNVFSSLAPGRGVVAATANQTTNYDIVQWGWTNEELSIIQSNDTYKLIPNAELFDNRPDKDMIIQEYGDCFTKSMGTLISSGTKIVKSKSGTITGTCSPENLGINNPTYGDGVFRYRLTGMKQYVLDHLLAIQDPGADGAQPQTPPTTGNIAGCPARADLQQQILSNPNIHFQSANPKNDVTDPGKTGDDVLCVVWNIAKQGNIPFAITVFNTGHGGCPTGKSNHCRGFGVDIGSVGTPDLNAVYRYIYNNKDALKINELIFSPTPDGLCTLKQGICSSYDAKTLSEHRDHVHLAVKGAGSN